MLIGEIDRFYDVECSGRFEINLELAKGDYGKLAAINEIVVSKRGICVLSSHGGNLNLIDFSGHSEKRRLYPQYVQEATPVRGDLFLIKQLDGNRFSYYYADQNFSPLYEAMQYSALEKMVVLADGTVVAYDTKQLYYLPSGEKLEEKNFKPFRDYHEDYDFRNYGNLLALNDMIFAGCNDGLVRGYRGKQFEEIFLEVLAPNAGMGMQRIDDDHILSESYDYYAGGHLSIISIGKRAVKDSRVSNHNTGLSITSVSRSGDLVIANEKIVEIYRFDRKAEDFALIGRQECTNPIAHLKFIDRDTFISIDNMGILQCFEMDKQSINSM